MTEPKEIPRAVEKVLARGPRTRDLAGAGGRALGTSERGRAVLQSL